MPRRKVEAPEPVAKVEPVDLLPKVNAKRYLTLTLPKSHYSSFGSTRIDTTVTLTADEADALATELREAAHALRSPA